MTRRPIPDWMIPSQCRVRTIGRGQNRVQVAMNTTQSAKPVLVRWLCMGEDAEWQHTPYQTADFRHSIETVKLGDLQ